MLPVSPMLTGVPPDVRSPVSSYQSLLDAAEASMNGSSVLLGDLGEASSNQICGRLSPSSAFDVVYGGVSQEDPKAFARES